MRDYLTLIRQLVYIMLGYQGIIVREFVGADGQFIIAVCYAHEDNMKKIAESMGLRKEVDLSVVDLLSLEPIDDKYRPLRMNLALWDVNHWHSLYGKAPEVMKLYYDINRLVGKFTKLFTHEPRTEPELPEGDAPQVDKIEGIDFHQLPRKCKGTLDKTDHIKEAHINDILEHEPVPLDDWMAYKVFLERLHARVKHIDEKHARVKAELRKKYLNVRVEEKVEKTDALPSHVVDKAALVRKLLAARTVQSQLFAQEETAPPVNKRSLYKIMNRYISGNRSTYRLKIYKLSKQLGEAYAVS